MNKQDKQRLIDTDNSVVVSKGNGGWKVAEDKGGQTWGDGRRLDLGWRAPSATDIMCPGIAHVRFTQSHSPTSPQKH